MLGNSAACSHKSPWSVGQWMTSWHVWVGVTVNTMRMSTHCFVHCCLNNNV